jgi:hypothetical protein
MDEIYCSCPLATVQQRFLDRQQYRHPGHRVPDLATAVQEWASKIRTAHWAGPVLFVDTSKAIAIDETVEWVTEQETAH